MDYPVWPIFIIQAIVFLLFFIPGTKKVAGLYPKTWILILLFIVCIATVVSLKHDSTDPLHLYF